LSKASIDQQIEANQAVKVSADYRRDIICLRHCSFVG